MLHDVFGYSQPELLALNINLKAASLLRCIVNTLPSTDVEIRKGVFEFCEVVNYEEILEAIPVTFIKSKPVTEEQAYKEVAELLKNLEDSKAITIIKITSTCATIQINCDTHTQLTGI
jgi:hypothetical protein